MTSLLSFNESMKRGICWCLFSSTKVSGQRISFSLTISTWLLDLKTLEWCVGKEKRSKTCHLNELFQKFHSTVLYILLTRFSTFYWQFFWTRKSWKCIFSQVHCLILSFFYKEGNKSRSCPGSEDFLPLICYISVTSQISLGN